jgi:signal transduction histidine kinase
MDLPVNILLVDDEPRNLDALEVVLANPGYRLVRAQTGNLALKALLEAEFAVIVLDIQMPDITGIELARIIKERKATQATPIIFLTAYHQDEKDVLVGYGTGAVDYLSKPVNSRILQSKVAVFVDLFRKTSALAAEVGERKRAEAAVQRLNAELEQRVRQRTAELEAANRELESFAYAVSHDLRAPLRAVDGFGRKLETGFAVQLGDEGRRQIRVIRNNAVRMGRLIDDLLAFSRMGRRSMTCAPVDMEALARGAIADARAAEPERAIEVDVGTLPAATGDAAMLRQVWGRLLSNAVKFTRPRPEARVEMGGREDGAELVYWVRDNGVGFDMQYADKLFGVFQRLHGMDEFEGTGVGLALSERIVHRHGGRMWADAQPDAGATFFFTLPRKPAIESERTAA